MFFSFSGASVTFWSRGFQPIQLALFAGAPHRSITISGIILNNVICLTRNQFFTKIRAVEFRPAYCGKDATA
jgi:hypothetical protein